MEPSSLIWIIACPFVGAFLLGLMTLVDPNRWDKFSGWIASVALFLSFAPAFSGALQYLSHDSEAQTTLASLGSWMEIGKYNLEFGFRYDALSSILCLVVTGVGLLIHIYSIGYMSHEKGRTRYFAYLNLFCGFMLVLISATSFPLLFVGWEGVGLSSYLLIGYWYADQKKAQAGRKAFVVNRIGDAGMLLAIFLAASVFHSFDIQEIAKSVASVPTSDAWILELMALLFFVGCVGKSAQFPLYIWLPDAMAGPTPVSALIHAATMVTSGVYLLARLAPLYAVTPVASEVVACTGAFTAIFAATIAMVQSDIKKVLAFSTVSQLGFMVLAMGVGVQWAGMFHLVTHAFFKALLFLGAGSVIHSLHDEQNIFKMGGLKSYLVGTTITFFAGYLGIIGFPLFSGWFSKDAVIFGTLETGHNVLFIVAVLAALLTTVYMTRLFCLVFLGVPKIPRNKLHEIHESPQSMLLPMWVLAFLAFVGGMLPFGSTFKEYFGVHEAPEAVVHSTWLTEGQFTIGFTLIVVALMVLTFKAYNSPFATRLKTWGESPLKGLLYRQYGFDDFSMFVTTRSARAASILSRLFDEKIVDGLLNRFVSRILGAASAFARLQSGLIQAYAFTLLCGCVVIGWILLKGGS